MVKTKLLPILGELLHRGGIRDGQYAVLMQELDKLYNCSPLGERHHVQKVIFISPWILIEFSKSDYTKFNSNL